jgi:hypothetical protein
MMNLHVPITRPVSTAIHIADGQKPFHDHRTWNLLLQFIRDLRPTFLINHGDDAECYHWSRYDKNPLDSPLGSFRWNADAERRAVQDTWDQLHDATPKSKFLYTLGNHEDRIRLYKPRIAADTIMAEDNFIDLYKAHKWWDVICEYGYGIKLGHLWLTHGHTAVEFSAKKMLREWGSSVAFGHTHKMDVKIENPKGAHIRGAWSIPCHCILDPHYVTQPGWFHGFAFTQFTRTGQFSIQVIPIVNYSCVFGGVRYSG